MIDKLTVEIRAHRFIDKHADQPAKQALDKQMKTTPEGVHTFHMAHDYSDRPEGQRPEIRSGQAKLAIASDKLQSFILDMGDDYQILLQSYGYTVTDQGAVDWQVRWKSNYSMQLAGYPYGVGPNPIESMEPGDPYRLAIPYIHTMVVQRSKNIHFHEWTEVTLGALKDSGTEKVVAGKDADKDALERQWSDWQPVRKTEL